MLSYVLVALQIFPMPSDPVRAAELQERALIARVREQESAEDERRKAQQRQFETRFNRLVEAVKSFAEHYNRAKGNAWPAREAAQLREAMRDLQSLERSLNPKGYR